MLVNVDCAKEQSRATLKTLLYSAYTARISAAYSISTLPELFSYDPDNKDNAEPKPRS